MSQLPERILDLLRSGVGVSTLSADELAELHNIVHVTSVVFPIIESEIIKRLSK